MSPKTIIISSILFLVFLFGLTFLVSSGQKKETSAASFSANEIDRPKAETKDVLFDMGEISVKDVKQQDFTIKNSGTKPLQILNINTSCGCTSGQIIYKDFTSKEYSMHAQSGYVTEIAPGDSAVVRLTYRPASMPVYGLVVREVYVTTNDPEHEKLVFGIKAKVK